MPRQRLPRRWTEGRGNRRAGHTVPRVPYADWAAVHRDLTRSLERLADGEFLVMGESCSPPRPRRGLFGRQPTTVPAPSRYVQALCVEDVLSAECVGATSQGGTWEMTDATAEQLRDLGWLTPREASAVSSSPTPNFAQYVDVTGAAALADLMVASLALLGVRPSALALQASSGGLRAVGD